MHDYKEPVDQLLRRGEPRSPEWPDYRRFGLGPQDVPELIRMATDPALNSADGGSREVWAPLHAWRALGQLRAAEAVEPLLALFVRLRKELDGDDWANEELPEVFGLIGPAALPALERFLQEHGSWESGGWAAADGIAKIAAHHAEARAECVAALARVLEEANNDPVVNGAIIGNLLDLKAVETAPAIEKAFAAGRVDESIAGGWDRAQWELGLTDKEPVGLFRPDDSGEAPLTGPPLLGPGPGKKTKDKARAKRKAAARARKRNRKKR
jgi:hypothetical protein